MNQKVYHTLEYYKILERLADYASCEEAKDRCHKLVPLTDPAEIAHLQETTADALSRLYRGSGISFSGVHNVNASLKRLDIGGTLNTTELLMICSLLEVAKRVKAYDRSDRNDEKTDSLSPLFSQIQPLSPLLDEIRRCVVGEDEIADDASAALSKIRKSIRGMNDRIHAQLTGLMNNTTTRSYLQDAVITMRDGRYCLPVRAESKTSVPGMVHDQSSSGSTLFIEPMAVVNLNNELKELFLKEQEEIDRILADLSNRVAENANGIRQDYTVLAELDFIFAKAELAKSYNGVAPIFNEEGRINIRKGRHPLLDPKKVVPIDVRLGADFRQLIVTGPNTGGKTVSLKTVGLLTLMGQSGLHIPAGDRSELAIFHEIFADIGDEQSIEQSLSTFSSHMTNIVRILQKADFRQEWYEKLEKEVSVLTAEKLYQYFMLRKRDPYLEESLRQEFLLCDHSFWQRMEKEPPQEQNKNQPPVPQENPQMDSDQQENAGEKTSDATPLGKTDPKEDEWKEHAKRIESDMETYAKDAAADAGKLAWMLKLSSRERKSYKEFLKRFAVVREEVSVDMDSFDYGFYMYGLQHYGNMPLIEENEFREAKKIEELVIAIDTSASCKEKLVQQFLNETGAILKHQESFFHKVHIRIIECDNQIQKDIPIKNLDEIGKYTEQFSVSGGYGTDFRPVFSYVEKLRNSGELKNLKGLMYFTDGYGEYPKKPTDYQTVFVFYGDDTPQKTFSGEPIKVPDWAVKLYLSEDTKG